MVHHSFCCSSFSLLFFFFFFSLSLFFFFCRLHPTVTFFFLNFATVCYDFATVMPELLIMAPRRKEWKRISDESSVQATLLNFGWRSRIDNEASSKSFFMCPRRPNRSRDWTELNCLSYHALSYSTPTPLLCIIRIFSLTLCSLLHPTLLSFRIDPMRLTVR